MCAGIGPPISALSVQPAAVECVGEAPANLLDPVPLLLAKVPLVGRLFGAENGAVRLSGNAVVPMVRLRPSTSRVWGLRGGPFTVAVERED